MTTGFALKGWSKNIVEKWDMTLDEYESLEEKVQLDTLRREGCYIGKRKEQQNRILMFQLEGFYVEIFYRKHRCIIERLRCLNSTIFLEPYLNQIDITASIT